MDISDPALAFVRAMSRESRIFNEQVAAAFQASKMFAAFADGAVARSIFANAAWRPLPGIEDAMRALTRFEEVGRAWQGFTGFDAIADAFTTSNSNLAIRAFAEISSTAWVESVRPILAEDGHPEAEPDALPADHGSLVDAWGGALQELWAWLHTRPAGLSAAAVGLTIVLAYWVPLARGRPDLATIVGPPLWGIVFLLLGKALAEILQRRD